MHSDIAALVDGLVPERRTSIQNALQSYKYEVAERNMRNIHALARQTIEDPFPPSSYYGHRENYQMRAFGRCYFDTQGELAGLPMLPEGLLDDSCREGLINTWHLDGVFGEAVDMGERSKWFCDVCEAINELSLEGDSCPRDLPADLVYLSTLVDAIHGPGLPSWSLTNQIDFISSKDELGQDSGETKQRVLVPPRTLDEAFDDMAPTDLYFVWQDWWKTVAFRTGDLSTFGRAGTYAVYCRRLLDNEVEEDCDLDSIDRDDWKPSDLEWRWRYGTHDGDWHSKLYDTVEEFLAWYAHCKEPTC